MAFVSIVPLTRRPPSKRIRKERFVRARCSFDAGGAIYFAFGGSLRGAAAISVAAEIRAVGAASTTLLAIDGAGLGNDGALAFADAFHALPMLEEAIMGRNEIGDDACAVLVDSMPTSLRVLDIAGNHAGVKTGHAIARLIARSKCLTHVYAMRQKGGGIGDDGVSTWPEAVRKNGENEGAFWFANVDGNGISEDSMKDVVNACRHYRRCVFPYSKYPGYNPKGLGL